MAMTRHSRTAGPTAARLLWACGGALARRLFNVVAGLTVERIIVVACLLASGSALGDTSVSGPIIANSTWLAANAPYTVIADVTVDSGAVLTVEAGVTVYANAGTSLVIKNGALVAQGPTALPIVVISYRDIANPNPAPAPADWEQLQFLIATVSGTTSLNGGQAPE